MVASATLAESQGVPQSAPATAAPPAAQAPRPPTPTRDPRTPGYVTATSATELPDGAVPPVDKYGNFILGPTHPPAPEMTVKDDVPHGVVHTFTMESTESKIYPGIARTPGTRATVDPADPAKRIVSSGPAPYTRRVAVYIPQQYVPGTVAPFIVGADGPDQLLFTALDNLIAQKRVPVMIAISIANGSGDAQGSQRGLEYDTMSGLYAQFVETEVLPLVEKQYNVRLTKDPDARATMGCSSGGSAALAMAWYRNDLYHRVLTYSGTYVNQQWPYNPEIAGRRLGVSPQPDSEEPGQADPPLDARQRPRQLQRERRHARLGARQPAHGQGARRQGLQVSVRLRAERRALRSRGEAADAAAGARMAVEGLSRRGGEERAITSPQLRHNPSHER